MGLQSRTADGEPKYVPGVVRVEERAEPKVSILPVHLQRHGENRLSPLWNPVQLTCLTYFSVHRVKNQIGLRFSSGSRIGFLAIIKDQELSQTREKANQIKATLDISPANSLFRNVVPTSRHPAANSGNMPLHIVQPHVPNPDFNSI
jgi:hypothetical protein